MRRALIPAKRSGNFDKRDIANGSVVAGKPSSSGVDDRIHNALLEELCADYGVTDSSSSYIDFLSFDIPVDRVGGGQLPADADLGELGEIVSIGTVKPKTESVHNVTEGNHRVGSSIHTGLVVPGVTMGKPASGIQMRIPDDVASPTISSSCEESKPADGGGEALSDFPPNVHSTTGCASVKSDTDTSISAKDQSQQLPVKSESAVEDKRGQVLTPSTQVPDDHHSSAASLTEDQPDGNSSMTSSPWHVAKKARMIASGGDLLADVKKSYAFVCGADMFAPPARPVVSQLRWHTPPGFQFQQLPYSSQNVLGTRSSFRDGRENPLRGGVQNPGSGQQTVFDNSYRSSFHSSTPVKGFQQHYHNEWQTSPHTGVERSYQTNPVQHTNMTDNGTVDFRPRSGQFMPGHCGSTGTGSDIRDPSPYASGVQYRRTTTFPGHADQNHLNYQSIDRSPRSAVDHSGRSYGYGTGPYAGSYEHIGRESGPPQNEFYRNPLASPYRGLPSHASNASIQHGTVSANESRNIYPTGHLYPAQRTHPANATHNEQVGRSLTASPVHQRGQSATTPGAGYSLPMGFKNYPSESNGSDVRYPCHDSATPTGHTPLMVDPGMQPAPMAPGIQNNANFQGMPTRNEFSSSRVNTGVDPHPEQQGIFPQSPVFSRSVVNQMTPHRDPDAEQSYNASSSLPAGRAATENGCLSFVRHLIGSGSGPYRSHPLFPLLRDLVIADMNFEAPSFPYPLIAGLPRSFDRLISNYFSCTAHSANSVSIDPSVDAIVMDALRYAHSALLGNLVSSVEFVQFMVLLCSCDMEIVTSSVSVLMANHLRDLDLISN